MFLGDNCQTVCKPGSVPPRPNSLSGDGHSSGTFVTERLARPTRAAARKACPAALAEASTACRSYLVLLPVGFTLPPPLPAARCALTAPFHPCRPPPRKATSSAVCFCGTFPGVAPAGRYPAPCLRGARTFLPAPSEPGVERPSDRLAGKIWDGAPRLSNRATGPARVRYFAERVAKPRVALNRETAGGVYERSPRSPDRTVGDDDRRRL